MSFTKYFFFHINDSPSISRNAKDNKKKGSQKAANPLRSDRNWWISLRYTIRAILQCQIKVKEYWEKNTECEIEQSDWVAENNYGLNQLIGLKWLLLNNRHPFVVGFRFFSISTLLLDEIFNLLLEWVMRGVVASLRIC